MGIRNVLISSFDYGLPWTLNQPTYVAQFDYTSGHSETITPEDIRLKTDGTKLFIADSTNNRVYEFALSSAWDITSASYDSYYTSSESASGETSGLAFSYDGTKMYIADGGLKIYQYSLSTAWDVSTASYDSKSYNTTSEGEYNPHSLQFKSDGTKMFVMDENTTTIWQYTLSTPWDISTASYDSKNGDLDINDTVCFSMKPDGGTLFVTTNVTDRVYQFDTAIFFDISTVTQSKYFKDTDIPWTGAQGVDLEPNGERMYVADDGTKTINQYTLI